MKKRLRKKLHKGEFAVHGVSILASFTHTLAPREFDQFVDDFIEDAIESKGLLFGGGGHPGTGWSGVVQPETGYAMISEVDLEQVCTWLSSRSDVESFEISEPWELWHGKNPHESDQELKAQQVGDCDA